MFKSLRQVRPTSCVLCVFLFIAMFSFAGTAAHAAPNTLPAHPLSRSTTLPTANQPLSDSNFPVLSQQTELPGSVITSLFDGTTALMGLDVYTYDGTSWSKQATLAPASSDPITGFGEAALSGDTILLGAQNTATHVCSVFVFVRSEATWQQQALIQLPDHAGDVGCPAVALDGDTAVFGVITQNAVGTVYVYVRDGVTWSQQAIIVPDVLASGDWYGFAVVVHGNTALVGSIGKNASNGAVFVFTRSGTTWSLQQTLTASDGIANDRFGWSIAFNGETILVGSLKTTSDIGAVYAYVYDGSAWSQQAKLTAGDTAQAREFGSAIALDGDTALIGAWSSTQTGAAYVFERNGATWTQNQKLVATDAQTPNGFGMSVALNGHIALISNPLANSGAGITHVFSPSIPTNLAFALQPAETVAQMPFGTPPTVVIRDTNTSIATGYTGPVTLTIKSGTGAPGAQLTGTQTVNAVAGVATFTDLAFTTIGSGYVLTATSPSLVSADSQTFDVRSPVVMLALRTVVGNSSAKQLSATLTMTNHTGATIAAGTPLTFVYTGAVFTPKSTITLSGGATFTKLTLPVKKALGTISGTLDTPLSDKASLVLTLTATGALHQSRLSVKANLLTYSSNSIDGITTDNAAQKLVAHLRKHVLTLEGGFFANNEPVTFTPVAGFGGEPTQLTADAFGRATCSLLVLPGTKGYYVFTYVGQWSGITGTVRIMLK